MVILRKGLCGQDDRTIGRYGHFEKRVVWVGRHDHLGKKVVWIGRQDDRRKGTFWGKGCLDRQDDLFNRTIGRQDDLVLRNGQDDRTIAFSEKGCLGRTIGRQDDMIILGERLSGQDDRTIGRYDHFGKKVVNSITQFLQQRLAHTSLIIQDTLLLLSYGLGVIRIPTRNCDLVGRGSRKLFLPLSFWEKICTFSYWH